MARDNHWLISRLSLGHHRTDLAGQLFAALRRRLGIGRGPRELPRSRAGELLDLADQVRLVVKGVAKRQDLAGQARDVLVALGLAVSQRLRESLETSCRVPPFQTFRRPRRRVLGNSGLKVDYDEAKYTTAVRSYLASVGYDSCFTIYIIF